MNIAHEWPILIASEHMNMCVATLQSRDGCKAVVPSGGQSLRVAGVLAGLA